MRSIYSFCLSGLLVSTVMSGAAYGQTAFYVDPTYVGGGSDGSAARPWTGLSGSPSSPQWTRINNALASTDVSVYFSARQAVSDVAEITHSEVNIWRTSASTNRLTLDGMSKYNTNDSVGVWVTYTGANKFAIKISSGFISIGVQGDQPAYPMHYTTIRGFDVSGSSGRVTFAGNYTVLENMYVHDIATVGPTIMFQAAVSDYPNCAVLFGNLHDITIRNNVIERGFGEGIYISGTYQRTGDGGCPSWGNTHRRILIEGNVIVDPGLNGGEGDGIDLKAGLMDVTVRNNVILRGHNGNRNCIASLGVFAPARTNYLVENNICRGTAGVALLNQNGTTLRNNVLDVVSSAGIDVSSEGGGIISNRDLHFYNNTLIGAGIGLGGADGAHVRNNIITGVGSTRYQLGQYDSINIDSDYNLLNDVAIISSSWPEGSHSRYVAASMSLFIDAGNGDFHLTSTSPAVDIGAELGATGFATDLEGTPRPQGLQWDLGAYEGARLSTTPSPPTNVRIIR